MNPEEPLLAGRYRLDERLGGSGLTRTWSAVDTQTEQPVILKELIFEHLDTWKAYELFERETEILQRLNHPHIPKYLASFQIPSQGSFKAYLVTEKVPGQSLAQWLKQGERTDIAQIKVWAEQLLEILIYLHGRVPPVIHRDIKPSNIMRDPEGKLWLIDFGAVQDLLRPEGSSTVVGTFGYMAPEQFSGRTTPQSDLYSLGATLVHLLAGRAPSELPQRELRLDYHAYVPTDPELTQWLDQLLAPMPEQRFASAHAALRALKEPQPWSERSVTPSRRSRQQRGLEPVSRPAGTAIQVRPQGSGLQITIPAAGLNWKNIPMLGFSFFWLSFVAVWTAFASMGGIFFMLFSVPFWLVGFYMGKKAIEQAFVATEISLTPDNVLLRQALGTLWQKSEETPLSLITTVERASNMRVNSVPIYHLAFKIGVRDLQFGTHLSEIEQRWVRYELLRYLTQQRPERAQEMLALSGDY
jgi:serine/threonine protein kinase